jgi:uncharacterized protein YneF (UPF0154 family)
MEQLLLILVTAFALVIGVVLGYFARQSIAKRDYKALETKVQSRLDYARH